MDRCGSLPQSVRQLMGLPLISHLLPLSSTLYHLYPYSTPHRIKVQGVNTGKYRYFRCLFASFFAPQLAKRGRKTGIYGDFVHVSPIYAGFFLPFFIIVAVRWGISPFFYSFLVFFSTVEVSVAFGFGFRFRSFFYTAIFLHHAALAAVFKMLSGQPDKRNDRNDRRQKL